MHLSIAEEHLDEVDLSLVVHGVPIVDGQDIGHGDGHTTSEWEGDFFFELVIGKFGDVVAEFTCVFHCQFADFVKAFYALHFAFHLGMFFGRRHSVFRDEQAIELRGEGDFFELI